MPFVQEDLQVLLTVRNLLSSPEAWGKGGLAWNEDKRKVPFTHPRACRFSLDGALHRVRHLTHTPVRGAYTVLCFVLTREGNISLAAFNDAKGTTHTAVLDLLDKGIRKLGGVPPLREEELQ